MKIKFGSILLCFMVFVLSACGIENRSVTSRSEQPSLATGQSFFTEQSAPVESSGPSVAAGEQEEAGRTARRISVQFGENVVVYELNNGSAATSFYEQLPLTIAVEDFSTNEKIFYPPRELDTDDSPLAQAGAGTLAYYAPWGDVVMFYGDYNENPSLYALGQVVSGGELVGEMSGVITIAKAD